MAHPLNAHALLIQICAYPRSPLPEVSDAADLAEVLKDPALCGYPPDQVHVLNDQEATREAIIAALRRLAAAANAHSTVVLYFSGHGRQDEDISYLIPIDADTREINDAAISTGDLVRELEPLRASKVLLIFDCCHAGGLEAKDVSLRPGLSAAAQDQLRLGRGWVMFAASDAGEASWVRSSARNGIFTKHLLAGMRGARPSDSGYVKVFDLFEYLQPLVSLEEPRQHPIFKCAVRENFAIARYRGGAIATVPRVDDTFLYHALLCYAQADAPFIRSTLLPRLLAAKLHVATAKEVTEPGLNRVIGIERGLEQARRTLVLVSRAFLRHEDLDDRFADHLALQRKHVDITSGRYSLIPVYLEAPASIPDKPDWLTSLEGIDLSSGAIETEDELQRLLRALTRPVPRR